MAIAPPDDEGVQVRERLASVGLDSMIDVHTHFMPDRVLAKVRAYFDAAGPLLGRSWPIMYRGDDEDRLARLRSFGVARFSSLNYPHKAGMAAWLNEWSAQFAAQVPECLPSATFYPEPEAAAYVREAVDRGARIFKVHVQVGNFDPNDPLLDEVWSLLHERRIPAVIHSGDGPVPGDHTGVAGVRRLLERFPGLVLIVAHMGMPEYDAFLDLADDYPSIYLDTTMVFTPFTEDLMPFPVASRGRLLELGDRILFGSDFPNIPHPFLTQVDAVLGLDLGDEWVRKVLRDNAVRLFSVD